MFYDDSIWPDSCAVPDGDVPNDHTSSAEYNIVADLRDIHAASHAYGDSVVNRRTFTHTGAGVKHDGPPSMGESDTDADAQLWGQVRTEEGLKPNPIN